MPRLRVEGRRRAASRSIAIETPKSAPRAHPAHRPQPPSQEDALLREQIDNHGGPGNWTAIAEALVGRSSKSCRLRCARPRTRSRARDAAGIAACSPHARPATPHRPARAFPGLILDRHPRRPPASPRVPFVVLTNRLSLFRISLFLPRRWCNQLNPSVKRGPFTEEEDKKILAAHAVYGNKWAVISRGIPGRYAETRAPRGTRPEDPTRSHAKRLARFPAALSSHDAEPSFWRSRHPRARPTRVLRTPARASDRVRGKTSVAFWSRFFAVFFLAQVLEKPQPTPPRGRKGEVGHFAPPGG